MQRLAAGVAKEKPQIQPLTLQGAAAIQLGHHVVEPVQLQIDQRLAPELIQRFHVGLYALAACLRQQRDIVAGFQVIEAAAQVDDVGGPVLIRGFFQRQKIIGADQVVTGIVGAPVAGMIHHNTQT